MESIKDAQGFISKIPITLSRGFSVETLTEVSPPWKTEYLEGCSTTMRCVVRKMAAVEGRLVWVRGGFTAGTLFLDR